ncbi:MAG: TDP-N-acetylfucosamine:lipid II N-acetylfucosaminyltransferase [Bacteroidales bacterium]|nr:TDP-N-acetylfucosamine:lipid II N-acetylfucosaminyltransferase [Bacteroidales bacterium]
MGENKISILHIASDEKFINAANYIFEKAFPGCNHFLIPHPRFKGYLTYVEKGNNIELVPFGKGLIKMLAGKTKNYRCVVLHGITEINSTVFLQSKERDKFIGILWGAELYTEENFSERRLKGPLTSAILLPEKEEKYREKLKKIIGKMVRFNPATIKDAAKMAASELQYFCVPYVEEFNLFKDKKLIQENCNFIPFTYYPLEYILKGHETSVVYGNDILVGNSASFTCNHLEAFSFLSEIGIENRKIIVPLSYGDSEYADYIQAKGNEIYNGNFESLRNFIPLQSYINVMLRCGIVIMNHYRQQALGNIFMMLWLGSRVYLNESNSVYHYLKRIGIIVFSIGKDLNKDNPSVLENLSLQEIEQNRAILKKTMEEKQVINTLKDAISNYFQ